MTNLDLERSTQKLEISRYKLVRTTQKFLSMGFAIYIAAILTTLNGFAKSPAAYGNKDTVIKKYMIQYDPNTLRIPGKSLSIGIVTLSGNGDTLKTKGFLGGKDNWSKYRIEVDGGKCSNGKIRISSSSDYKKSDSLTVNLYTRKWLLGGKDKWLLTQKIPYNYETAINILTTGNFSKAPGDHVKFGVRTWYDNKMFADKWYPVNKNDNDCIFGFENVHISKSKGDLKIDNDPAKIVNDKVKLTATLAKFPALTDTLQIILDYVAKYQCKIQSGSLGHDLSVTANVFADTIIHANILQIRVNDNAAKRIYNYWVNTNGGSLNISSRGGDGNSGRNGWDGQAGLDGSSGIFTTNTETVIGADGTPTTTTTTVQGPGGDGSRGGDGGNGGDGDNGYNGGNITITYTPAAKPYQDLIKAVSIPGSGGSGGQAGQGGRGGSGGSGNPSGNSGSNGMDGFRGSDGSNGKPGKVIFVPQP
jgi:hypothetical protein